MTISTRNIRCNSNVFIDNIYNTYVVLSKHKAFTKEGYENDGFKIWRRDDEYYILNKSTGIIITWHKLLGWQLASNFVLKNADIIRFCELLKENLQANDINVDCPDKIDID